MSIPQLPPDHPAVEAAAKAVAHFVGDGEADDGAFDIAYAALQAAAAWLLSPRIAAPFDPGRGQQLAWAMRRDGAVTRLRLAQVTLDHWDEKTDGATARAVIDAIAPLLYSDPPATGD